MTDFEVPEAIICSPFEEPTSYWYLQEGEEPDKREGRRPAIYYYPEQTSDDAAAKAPAGTAIELKLVNLIRSRVKQWRTAGYPGVTATTLELLNYWRREGRGFRFFFAQLESAETIIFLNETRLSSGPRHPTRRAKRSAEARARVQGVSPLRLQDGHWLRQNDSHGYGGGVEHPQ